MIKVFVATPTMGTVVDGLPFALRDIEERYKDEVQLIYPKVCVRRMFHDFARNALVEEFIESEADILWFLDSDIIPPPHVLDLITLHGDKWQAAGAPYPVWMTPEGFDGPQVCYTVYKKAEKGLHSCGIPDDGTDWVDGIATGCLFIKREVFKDMPKPYFEHTYDPETRLLKQGEDIGFCHKLSDRGIQFFIDFSMRCKHFKTVCLLDVNDYALSYAKISLNAYQRTLRDEVERRSKTTPIMSVRNKLVLPPGM